MLDHVFISVTDLDRSIAFYTAALTPLGITKRVDYDGKDGPPGHPDLKGFGANGRIFFWRQRNQSDCNPKPQLPSRRDPQRAATLQRVHRGTLTLVSL